MLRLGLEDDEFTSVNVLGVSVYLGSDCSGKQVHCVTIKNCMCDSLFVANAAFNLIPKDSVSWNALITGLGHNEEEDEQNLCSKR
jgi:hypothetical protein